VDISEIHLRDVVHALLDVGDLLFGLEILEDVGVCERDVDALQVEQVPDIVDRARCHDRKNSKLIRLVEVARKLGTKAKEGALG
jgi:hypothetical protein